MGSVERDSILKEVLSPLLGKIQCKVKEKNITVELINSYITTSPLAQS